MIGWTTVASEKDAQRLTELLISKKLAACIQVDPSVNSYYHWNGKLQCEQEFRLSVKFASNNASAIKTFIEKHHPYDTPQWVAIIASDSLDAYKEWVFQKTVNKAPRVAEQDRQ